MKIQCDVCEKAPATMICCADEAALCAKCDVEVHAANKLASKHQRLVLDSLANKLPRCDICQEKTAFIFCVEDRALFCKDCDEPIHSAGSLAANHQRFLATGIRVALSSSCNNEAEKSCFEPPNQSSSSQQQVPVKLPPAQPQQQQSSFGSPWGVDDLLRFPEFGSPADKKEQMQMGEFEWLAEMGIFGDQFTDEALAAAEVPQLPASPPPPPPTNFGSYKPAKSGMPHKKQRIEIVEEDDEYFMVPDIG